MAEAAHIPVMYNEMLEYMSPADGEVYVDGTFGAGGYTKGLLNAADCSVYAIDRDPNVQKLAEDLKQKYPGRVELLVGNFADMDELLKNAGVEGVNGVVLDIGVSSMQIDNAGRGFSFQKDGPLDMRMSCEGLDAATVVNQTEENELADIIYKYGGERKSRRVARAIVQARKESAITTTKQLADIVRSVVRAAKDKIDPATRTFQALRIWVNDELGQLTRALDAAENILLPGGRLVIVSFHSLEDSIVKSFINDRIGKMAGISRHMPLPADYGQVKPTFKALTKRAISASEGEIKINIRSRSAKLRAAIKLEEATS